jgi:hypothetical protein
MEELGLSGKAVSLGYNFYHIHARRLATRAQIKVKLIPVS